MTPTLLALLTALDNLVISSFADVIAGGGG
jgi:hypothetical protein